MTDSLYKLTHIGLLKTVWFNFRVLPFGQAVRFPILLSRSVRVGACRKGSISLPDGGKMQVGFHGFGASNPQKSNLSLSGKLVLKGKGFHVFGQGLILKVSKGAVLQIGNNFSCHRNNTFLVNKSIVIGDDNMWSFENVTMDTDAHVMFDSDGNLLNPNKEVRIGNHVWVGCRNTVLKGADVPDGCVLGSGGTVTKKLEKPGCVYIGNKLLRENVIWTRDRNVEGLDAAKAFSRRQNDTRI